MKNFTSQKQTVSNRDANILFFSLVAILVTLAAMIVSNAQVINLI